MQTRTFGRTGVAVSEIGHGTWTMGSMWGVKDDDEALRALRRSLELGVSFIDTALVYGYGHSEKLIGQVLRETSSRPFIATKIPPKNGQWPGRPHVAMDEVFPKEHIISSTEKSLQNLGVDTIDLQQLHVWTDPWLKDKQWIKALEKLKKQGKIRFIGVSINDHDPNSALEIVASGLIDSVQVIYNIFDQSAEEKLFPLCQEKNVAVIARVPFDEGSLTATLTTSSTFPTTDWRRLYFMPERLPEICARVEKLKFLIRDEITSLPQAALKFILSHPAVSTVIPGMRKIKHVEDCLKASDGLVLKAGELETLKGHAWPRNFYPQYGD